MQDGFSLKDRIDLLQKFWAEYSVRQRHYENLPQTFVTIFFGGTVTVVTILIRNPEMLVKLKDTFLRPDDVAGHVAASAIFFVMGVTFLSFILLFKYSDRVKHYKCATRHLENMMCESPIARFCVLVEKPKPLRTLGILEKINAQERRKFYSLGE